jgi:small redox-active disulfide protein 2
MQIQILGIGCGACRKMESNVREYVQKKNLNATVERVEDLEVILRYELFALPGLVVDGKVVACGYAGKNKLEQVLRKACV